MTDKPVEKKMVLTNRQKEFAKLVVEGVYSNAECARRAGYSSNSEKENAYKLLTISDLAQCLDIFEKNGGLINSLKVSQNNKFVIDKWAEKNEYVINFIKDKKYQAISPVYLVFKKKIKYEKLFRFLSDNEIAYDIKNYRLANPGIRIWTGPTIKKNDLIALTNWLDWCFNKFK